MKNNIFYTGFFLLFLIIGTPLSSKGQASPDSLKISLITSGPGEELYSLFGHSAVRVKDYSTGEDYVFNYGTFDFSTPHFYWKFIRGRLMYFLSVQKFPYFFREYKADNRKITEQVLNLSDREKKFIFNYLKVNYQPKNKFYKYNFLFDNCATRIRDIIADSYGKAWKIQDIIPESGLTFRDVINQYLKEAPWERLGINLAFGERADEAMTNRESMFLPKFLKAGFGQSTINGKPLVKRENLLYIPTMRDDSSEPFYLYPVFLFSILCAFILIVSFSKPSNFSNKILPWIDRCLFFLTGLIGCFLLFMWFGTAHSITKWNYNLLWLFPFNIIFSFHFFKDKKWVRNYAILIFGINAILLIGYLLLPQELPLVALLFIAILAVRSLKIISKFLSTR